MPVYELSGSLIFPDPELAHPSGLLAIGGDLSVPRLLLAYSNGIFPWYSEGEEIMWWSPDPRMVLFPEKFKPSKSLRKLIASELFEFKINTCFSDVIRCCGEVPRKGQNGTWITNEMNDAYTKLHLAGYAHSFETFLDGQLAGGLYGVSIGKAFFGESMFHLVKDASKVAFAHFIAWCLKNGIQIIDAQQKTQHLESLGATEIPRKEFLNIINQ